MVVRRSAFAAAETRLAALTTAFAARGEAGLARDLGAAAGGGGEANGAGGAGGAGRANGACAADLPSLLALSALPAGFVDAAVSLVPTVRVCGAAVARAVRG